MSLRAPQRSASSCSRSRSRLPRRHRTASSTSKFSYGPVKIAPGQNTIAIERNDAAAGGRRLDRRLPARPRAQGRQRPARRRDPPASRRLDLEQRAAVRGRRGEDRDHRAARLRLALSHQRPLAHEPHDPQPHADAGRGLHHLRDRLHPGRRAGRAGDPDRSRRRSSTRSAASTRSSTPSAAAADRTAASRIRTRPRARRGPRGPCPRTARSSAPAGTCTRAGCGPT